MIQAVADRSVSNMTLRRDLRELEGEGKRTRVYRGAVAAAILRAASEFEDLSSQSLMSHELEAKQQIVAAAVLVSNYRSLA